MSPWASRRLGSLLVLPVVAALGPCLASATQTPEPTLPVADAQPPAAEEPAAAPAAASTAEEPVPDVSSTPSQWAAITMFHGLPSRNVRAITQDGDGILWFGTDAGLVRYDGLRIERVPLERASIARPAAAVRALAVDGAGRLWVGTATGAFVRGPHGAVPVPQTAAHGINAVLAAAPDRVLLASERGTLFTCTPGDDGALAVESLGPAQAGLLRDSGEASLALVALAARGSSLVVGTRGRSLLTLHGGTLAQLPDPARPFFVTAMVGDGNARILLGAETNPVGRGLFALEGERTRALDVRTGPVAALALDGSGDLWVGTRGRGLIRVRGERALARHTVESSGGGLTSNRILSLFADRDGVLWIGTDRGVCRHDPRAPRQERLGPTPEDNFVHALLSASDGRLWAGTQRGLFVRERPDVAWMAVTALGTRAVYALHEANGVLLAGTAGGLFARAPVARPALEGWRAVVREDDALRAGSTMAASQSVRGIQALAGSVYLATFGRGLERLDGEAIEAVWPPADAPPELSEVVSVSAAHDALWIGTARAGVYVWRDGEVKRDQGLSALGVLRDVMPDGRGGLWLGTERGLYAVSQDGIEALLEGQEVRALLPDAGALAGVWCATAGAGVIKVVREPHVGVLTARLGVDYGLPSESVFALAAVPGDGEAPDLVFGTNRGLVCYGAGGTPPGLRLVQVLGRRSYAPEEWAGLIFDYPQNSLLVQAAAIGSRTYPEHFQYVFTLLGADGRALRSRLSRDGQYVAEGLSPGSYRIEARALGLDLVPSTPITLSFEVSRAPVPWPSIALGVLLAGALAALAWGHRQNRRLARAHQALSQTRLQLVQETETERRRIARDLHDQTLADLRRLLLTQAGAGGPDNEAPRFREAVEGISTEVRRICEDLSPSVLENVGLTAALEWALEEAVRHPPEGRACRGEFACGDDVAERLALEPAVEIQIYRIVQEALANAVRHAAPSVVRVAVSLGGDGTLVVAVEDDGRGFDPGRVVRGRGVANIRSRAGLIGAQVEWLPRSGGGCLFRLTR